MFKMYQFQCTNPECRCVFDDLVDTPTETDQVLTECPQCSDVAEICIGNPRHHKHVSMSSWRSGHGS